MQGSTDELFFVYIRPIHLTKHSSNFSIIQTMSKITHTKKVIEDQNVCRSELVVIKDVKNYIQRSISYIKDELQNPIENNLNHFGCMVVY